MTWLGSQSDTVFIGQAVASPGTSMTGTLIDVPDNKKIEMPVSEEMQMGITIGMAVDGSVPVSIYPRWNFLILAANQLLSHLDKYYLMSDGGINPIVAIRCAIPTDEPLDPGHQHKADYTDAFDSMLDHVNVVRLIESDQIVEEYLKILQPEAKPTIFVEYIKYYEEK